MITREILCRERSRRGVKVGRGLTESPRDGPNAPIRAESLASSGRIRTYNPPVIITAGCSTLELLRNGRGTTTLLKFLQAIRFSDERAGCTRDSGPGSCIAADPGVLRPGLRL